MAEFREALNDEIEAATSSAASSAVPLINGKRIGLVGTFTHYAFTVESALMLPTDAQGDLHIQWRTPVAASVISIEGLAVTISVGEDIGPFVPFARLQSDMVYLLRSLIRRIEDYGDQKRANQAGDRLLGAGEVHGVPVDLKSALSPELLNRLKGRRLNERQLEALASVLGRDTTFIWGPPGTGKTSTIGAIGECLYAMNRSLLVVSHTNTAVDQALLRIGEAIDDEELRNGAVFRIGQPRDQRLAETEDLLLSTHVHRRSEEMVARRSELEASRAEKGIDLKAVERLIELCEWYRRPSQKSLRRGRSLRRSIPSRLRRSKPSGGGGSSTTQLRAIEGSGRVPPTPLPSQSGLARPAGAWLRSRANSSG